MKTVLVVDDSPSVLRLFDATLSEYDVKVRLAGGGKEALDIYRSEPVDLVLLDLQMPRVDGPQTLAALKAIDPKVFCCVMSAAQPSDVPGAAGFFKKPFSLDELRELIEIAIL